MLCCMCGNSPCTCPRCEVSKEQIDNAMLMPGEYRIVNGKYYVKPGMLDGYIGDNKKYDKEFNNRQSDLHWLAMADLTAKKSKCQKRQIGAVIVTEDGRCVSCAYNFHPRNTDLDHECLRKDIPTGTRMDIGYCCHAEINAIIFTDWHDLQGATIYLTQAPCPACAPYLIQAGLSKIVYYKDEVKRPNGIEIIKALTSNHLEIRAYDRSVKE